MITLVGNEKGGSGKSILATNLAALAAGEGRKVVLIDTDPQGTSSMWSTLRREVEAAPIVLCLRRNGSQMQEAMAEIASKADEVIIDAGGRDSLELRTGLVLAHKVLVPFKPSQFDVWALSRMAELIEKARELNPTLRGLAVINQASTNPRVRETGEAREFMPESNGFALAESALKDRVAYGRAAAQGLGVTEARPLDANAAAEITALYQEVFHG